MALLFRFFECLKTLPGGAQFVCMRILPFAYGAKCLTPSRQAKAAEERREVQCHTWPDYKWLGESDWERVPVRSHGGQDEWRRRGILGCTGETVEGVMDCGILRKYS